MYYKNRIYKVIGFILLCMIYAGFVLRFNVGIPCIFYKITGLKCPGCGITRMLLSIWKLDFRSAYEANQMIFILQPVLYYFIAEKCACLYQGTADDLSQVGKCPAVYPHCADAWLFCYQEYPSGNMQSDN